MGSADIRILKTGPGHHDWSFTLADGRALPPVSRFNLSISHDGAPEVELHFCDSVAEMDAVTRATFYIGQDALAAMAEDMGLELVMSGFADRCRRLEARFAASRDEVARLTRQADVQTVKIVADTRIVAGELDAIAEMVDAEVTELRIALLKMEAERDAIHHHYAEDYARFQAEMAQAHADYDALMEEVESYRDLVDAASYPDAPTDADIDHGCRLLEENVRYREGLESALEASFVMQRRFQASLAEFGHDLDRATAENALLWEENEKLRTSLLRAHAEAHALRTGEAA